MTIDSMIFDFDSSFIPAIILIAIVLVKSYKKHHSWYRLIFLFTFFIYFMGVLNYTVFPFDFVDRGIEYNKMNSINLTPLNIQNINEALLNILLTIPFGIMYPIFSKKHSWKISLLYGALFGISIELIQLTILILSNLYFRVVDVNDVIFNTIGAVIGYALVYAVVSLIKMAKLNTNVGIIEYLFEKFWG